MFLCVFTQRFLFPYTLLFVAYLTFVFSSVARGLHTMSVAKVMTLNFDKLSWQHCHQKQLINFNLYSMRGYLGYIFPFISCGKRKCELNSSVWNLSTEQKENCKVFFWTSSVVLKWLILFHVSRCKCCIFHVHAVFHVRRWNMDFCIFPRNEVSKWGVAYNILQGPRNSRKSIQKIKALFTSFFHHQGAVRKESALRIEF